MIVIGNEPSIVIEARRVAGHVSTVPERERSQLTNSEGSKFRRREPRVNRVIRIVTQGLQEVNAADMVSFQIRNALMIIQCYMLYPMAIIRQAESASHVLEGLFHHQR